MKIKVSLILLLAVFILSGVSSAFAAAYEGKEPVTVQNGDSFTFYLLSNEEIVENGYDSNMLTLTRKDRSDCIDGYWSNIYTFKANEKGTTTIQVIESNFWWNSVRIVTVNIL